MNQTAEDLQKAYEILGERGWCQGVIEDEDGHVCVSGAVWLAVGRPYIETPAEFREVPEYVAVRWYEALRVLLALMNREPSQFNDDPNTTFEDVQLLLKRGIEKAEHDIR